MCIKLNILKNTELNMSKNGKTIQPFLTKHGLNTGITCFKANKEQQKKKIYNHK